MPEEVYEPERRNTAHEPFFGVTSDWLPLEAAQQLRATAAGADLRQQAFAALQQVLPSAQQRCVVEQQANLFLQQVMPFSQQPFLVAAWQQALSDPQQASF